MKHWYQKVNPNIAEYVRTILILENIPNTEIPNLPLYTQGMPALLCKLGNNSNEVTLFGQSVPIENWSIENNQTVIAFFLKPFAMGTIFKIAAKDLKEKPIELNLWNAQKAIALNLQLCHSVLINYKMEVISNFILSQIQANESECKIIRIASDKLMENSNADALSQLLNELHLTERTFQRIFRNMSG